MRSIERTCSVLGKMDSNHRLSVQGRASIPLDHSRMLRCAITARLVERTRTADPPVPNRVLFPN